MKKIIITLLLINSYLLKSQNWEWVKLIQPNDSRAGMGVKVSPHDGYLYSGGAFNQSINLGNGHTLSGNSDGLLAQFDTAGACQWAKRIYVTTQGCGCNVQGNTSGAGVMGFDSGGNLIVAGSFCGCGAEFGGISTSYPGYALFLAKYSPSGTCLWVQTKPGSYNSSTGETDDVFNAITIDAADNIYVSIFNYATSTTFCGLSLANQGDYLLKINSSGNGIWKIETDNVNVTSSGYGISSMQYSNKRIYAVGSYLGTQAFGTYTFTSQGSVDLAAIKMDTAGNILAASDIASTDADQSFGIATSNNRIVLLAQSGANAVTIGTHTLNTDASKDKTFLVAYDTTSLSVQSYTNTANDNNGRGTQLYNDNKGNMYLLATNSATTGFANLTGVTAGNHIIKMDNTLATYWHLENTNTCLAPDTLGNLYTVDVFAGSNTYGTFTETAANGITLGKISGAYTTGLDDRMAHTNTMQVYPNPSSSLFNLKIEQGIKSKRNIVVTLYDNNGRQIDNVPYTQTDDYTLQINLTGYAQGLYMVKATIDNVLYSAKLER